MTESQMQELAELEHKWQQMPAEEKYELLQQHIDMFNAVNGSSVSSPLKGDWSKRKES